MDKNKMSFLRGIKKPIIVFGCGSVGKLIERVLSDNGIIVECFCDNNEKKHGDIISDKKVISFKKLKSLYEDALIVISVVDISSIVNQIDGYDFLAGSEIIKDHEYDLSLLDVDRDFLEFAISSCIVSHENYLNPNGLYLRSIDFIITEKCSLRCRDCSNLMQYYTSPKNINFDDLEKELDLIFKYVDSIHEIRLIGGEPLMHPKWHESVERLLKEEKVSRIVIFTNGTILPSDDVFLNISSKKLLFFITEYNDLSKNANILSEKLAQYNIPYVVSKASGWTNCSEIAEYERSEQTQRSIFDDCCVKNLITYTDSKIFRCPFLANLYRLTNKSDVDLGYYDLNKAEDMFSDVDYVKNEIGEFLHSEEVLNGCKYCPGRALSDIEIEPAIQIKEAKNIRIE